MSAPAGWYPDAVDPSLVRYWDGERWTESALAEDRAGFEPSSVRSAPKSVASDFLARNWKVATLGLAVGLIIGSGVTAVIVTNMHDAQERKDATAAAASAQAEVDAAAVKKAGRAAILPGALAACGLSDNDSLTMGDGNLSLTFDSRGEEDYSGVAVTDVTCVFDQLRIPAAVTSHIEQTTAMDGRQEDSWDGITVSWSYHPDRGLDGVLTVDGAFTAG